MGFGASWEERRLAAVDGPDIMVSVALVVALVAMLELLLVLDGKWQLRLRSWL